MLNINNNKNRKLKLHRKKIDLIDKRLIKLLSKRISIVKKIGKIKKMEKIPIQNEQRENEIIKTIDNYIKKPAISKYIKIIYNSIFEVSKEIEKEVE